jgi:hypothetical protein
LGFATYLKIQSEGVPANELKQSHIRKAERHALKPRAHGRDLVYRRYMKIQSEGVPESTARMGVIPPRVAAEMV